MDPTRSSGQVSGGILDLAKKERSIQYYVDMADDLGSIGLWIQLHKNGDEWRLKAKSRLPTSTLVQLHLEVELFYADDRYHHVSNHLFANIVSKYQLYFHFPLSILTGRWTLDRIPSKRLRSSRPAGHNVQQEGLAFRSLPQDPKNHDMYRPSERSGLPSTTIGVRSRSTTSA